MDFETIGYANEFWAWKNNTKYWETVDNMPGAVLGKPIHHLKSVCWFGPYVSASQVLPCIKYRVYILHGIEENSTMVDKANIFVEYKKEKEDDSRYKVIH